MKSDDVLLIGYSRERGSGELIFEGDFSRLVEVLYDTVRDGLADGDFDALRLCQGLNRATCGILKDLGLTENSGSVDKNILIH